MKRIFRNSRLIAITFFTVFATSVTHASARADSIENPVVLKFIGMMSNDPLFLLNVSGDSPDEQFAITIRDYEGTVLYRETIGGKSFSKKFLLNKSEIGDDILFFEIKTKNARQSVIYQVSAATTEVFTGNNTKLIDTYADRK